jgi:hypothetical protein
MAKFLKHVGKHGDRKVAVVFRQIPGEEHMCLVVYTETLNRNIHDPMMTAIESDAGQTSENLGDALNRSYTQDGKIILQMLHREGMLKKVQTEQIIMTPAPNQKIRLDELNGILNEMAKGEEAVKRLAEIDSSRGLQDPKDVARRKNAVNESKVQQAAPAVKAVPANGILDDNALADNLRSQALRMASEAKNLLAEADRLIREASQLSPEPVVQAAPVEPKKTRTRKAPATVEVVAAPPVAKKATRSRKAAVTG